MNTMDIPADTLTGKVVIAGFCGLFALGILAWSVPKFIRFLRTVVGATPGKPGARNIHLVLGFFIYLAVFAAAAMAAFIGARVATAQPTRISPAGITGVDWSCSRELGFFSVTCTSPLGWRANSRQTIQWPEIEKVDCISGNHGTISQLTIFAPGRRIQIGSLAVHDLKDVHQLILSQAPKSAVRACGSW
jgi:hypothetical protein